MRLKLIQDTLNKNGLKFEYIEEDGLGSIDFDYRGVAYHVWEFNEGRYGVESNVKHGGWQEEYFDDYEEEIVKVIENWK